MQNLSERVSIVLCTFNGEKYITEQIDSLLAQTYPIYEIVVQDDCSDDNTWLLLLDYASRYDFIKLFKNPTNIGLNENFLSAFKKATGDFIAISDQDDVWEKDKVAVCMNEFVSGDYSMIYSDSYITDENLNVKYATNFIAFTIMDLLWMGVAPGHSMIFKRTILDKIKNLDQIDFIYDWLINIAAAAAGNVKKTDYPLTYWRKHSTNVTDPAYTPPSVRYKKPLMLTGYVLWELFKGNTVKNFKWQFCNIYLILLNYRDNLLMKKIISFLEHYKQESLFRLMSASFIYAGFVKNISLVEKIKTFYSPIYKYYFYKRDGAGLRGRD